MIHNLLYNKPQSDKTQRDAEIAKLAHCSARAVRRIRSNLLVFGTTKAPLTHGGRLKTIAPTMLTALLDQLAYNPCMRLADMANFLHGDFDTVVTRFSTGSALKDAGWSRKTTQNIAKERNPDLRDEYVHEVSSMRSDQMVIIDETVVDKSIGIKRKGWAPANQAISSWPEVSFPSGLHAGWRFALSRI